MFVQDLMQTKLITVTPETTLPEAIRLTGQRGIRHLPVLEDGTLVGMVSDRDLKRAMASPATSLDVRELNYLLDRLRVGEIMTRGVITARPTTPVEEAARLMAERGIGSVGVRRGAKLVGLVTERDLLAA